MAIVSKDVYDLIKKGKVVTLEDAPRRFIKFKVFLENTKEFIWCVPTQIGGIGWYDSKVAVKSCEFIEKQKQKQELKKHIGNMNIALIFKDNETLLEHTKGINENREELVEFFNLEAHSFALDEEKVHFQVSQFNIDDVVKYAKEHNIKFSLELESFDVDDTFTLYRFDGKKVKYREINSDEVSDKGSFDKFISRCRKLAIKRFNEVEQ